MTTTRGPTGRFKTNFPSARSVTTAVKFSCHVTERAHRLWGLGPRRLCSAASHCTLRSFQLIWLHSELKPNFPPDSYALWGLPLLAHPVLPGYTLTTPEPMLPDRGSPPPLPPSPLPTTLPLAASPSFPDPPLPPSSCFSSSSPFMLLFLLFPLFCLLFLLLFLPLPSPLPPPPPFHTPPLLFAPLLSLPLPSSPPLFKM